MAAGSFDAPLETGGRDEIGELARALESMRASLKESFGVLTADRNKLEAIFDGLTDAVMVVDYDGPLRFSNSAAADLLDPAGLPPEAMLPQLRRAAEVGFAAHPALRIGDRAYAMQARSLPDERAVLAVVRDRTEEMRREFAEADFVSNAAHELRNPLAGISGAIEVLQGGAKDDPKARDHFLDRLAEDAERMNRLTRSLLTLARVESLGAGETEVVDVPAAIRDVVEAVEPPSHVELRVEVEPDLAAKGDPTLLRQVMVGLLTNAFKHTPPPGTVTVRGRRDGETDVIMEVIDTGTGIPAAEIERVFERFYRRAESRKHEGFGLGLAIARRMVDVMGGEIGATSVEGEGSTFWVRLPVAQAEPDPGRMSGLTMSSGRILIADDEPSVRDSVGYALAQEGFEVTPAADGDEAAEKLGDGIPFDLLILDIMMPGPSGLDICRDVRSRSAVPIIVLTAKDAEVDKVVGLEVGADDYVTKPFSVRELLGRVRAQLRRRELDRAPLAQAVQIEAGPVAIDLVRHVATVRGEPVNLTRSEFQLLRLLVGRPGEVFPRRQIMEELWQTEFDGDERACDVHISNLRQKVERDPQNPELVVTVRGVGYKFSGRAAPRPERRR